MTSGELLTANPDIRLVPIDIERDAPAGVRWLAGASGRETLRLMGVIDSENHASNLEQERKRLRDIIANPHKEAWMIKHTDGIVGIVEVVLADQQYLPAPAISIMIGEPSARGKGIGTGALNAALQYVAELDYPRVYARHLADNAASAALLIKCGFVNDGPLYRDADKLNWQNMSKELD